MRKQAVGQREPKRRLEGLLERRCHRGFRRALGVCAVGHHAEGEVAVLALGQVSGEEKSDAALLVDATNAFRSLN